MNLTYFTLLVFPMVLLSVVSLVVHVENKADSWRMLLTLPNSRWQLLLTKLIISIFLLGVVMVLFLFSTYILAFPIYWIHPETEFMYYTPDFPGILSDSARLFVYSLGIIGIQFLIALTFKNQILPLSLGIIFFVLGFIFSMAFISIAVYFPYSFPLLYKDLGMAQLSDMGNTISKLWIKSCFILFIAALISFPVFVSKK